MYRASAIVLVNQIHQITERVILLLMVSIITYPYWFGILISGQMLQNNLGQLPFSPNAVHYLIGFVLGYESGLYELHKNVLLLLYGLSGTKFR